MKNILIKTSLLICFLTVSCFAQAQTAAQKQAKIKNLVAVIEANPNNIEAHGDYLFLEGWDSLALKQHYFKWMQQSRFSINTLLYLSRRAQERPEAKDFLIKAIAIDSTRADVWDALGTAYITAGDNLKYSECKMRAADLAPKNADYVSNYMYSLKKIDTAKYKAMLAEFDDRFPHTVRGAQSLYWLSRGEADTLKRIKILERLNAEYHSGNQWSDGMDLYYLYLQTNPQKAVALANSNHWPPKAMQAQKLVLVNQLSAQGKYNEAAAVVDSLMQMKSLYAADLLNYKKAELYARAGNPRRAYDTLMKKMVTDPTNQLHNLLLTYGEKIGKHENDIANDWWQLLEKKAKLAPVFSSQLFTSDNRVSLADYRGKVVLLTFWFPGCGPCRDEFPYFEKVLKNYSRDQVAYLGVNGMEEQNGEVMDVVEKEKLTFTPLHGTRKAEQIFDFSGYPANFLIDKQGRIIFRDFQINAGNQGALKLMMDQLLNADDNTGRHLMVDSTKLKN